MLNKYLRWLVPLLFGLAASIAVADSTKFVGTQNFHIAFHGTTFPMRLFYPTHTKSEVNRFGPWELDQARNAPLTSNQLPLVVISHGLGGTSWNHHLLASALVKSGFLVAAPHHHEDWLRIGTQNHWYLRPQEITATLDFLLGHPDIGPNIDPTRIGAYGFSLGGYTMTALAGGQFDLARIDDHCKTPEKDPEFCLSETTIPMSIRAKRMLYTPPDVVEGADVWDHRIKALALSAPVGVVFTDLSRVTIPVTLTRAGDDTVLKGPFHAQNIHARLGFPHEYRVLDGVHHFAFLSPFPESIRQEVGPPAQDPPGFDRREFLAGEISKITGFFSAELGHE